VPAFQVVAQGNFVLADRYSNIFVTSDGFILCV
jgi:hypothetical protein